METAANKFSELINGDKPVLVDFSAEWCGPCKMMPPILKEVKNHLGDKVTIIKIDIDKSPQTAAAYKIQSVPTLVLFKQGQVKWRQSGVVPANHIEQVLDKTL
jgi:thioredoxin 1